jgi:hypothetical protein
MFLYNMNINYMTVKRSNKIVYLRLDAATQNVLVEVCCRRATHLRKGTPGPQIGCLVPHVVLAIAGSPEPGHEL